MNLSVIARNFLNNCYFNLLSAINRLFYRHLTEYSQINMWLFISEFVIFMDVTIL
jgi:hypothetical protein